MTDRIRIGVSAVLIHPDPQNPASGRKTVAGLLSDMARYLSRPGVTPYLIPDLDPDPLQEMLAEMDGFVLQGGADISPKTYNQPHLDEGRWPGDPLRDHYELKILDYAVANDKPVLGICRGCQLINVYFGGTLYQDLRTEMGDNLAHRDSDLYDRSHHPILFEPGGLLAEIYPYDNGHRVNSVHHQGIRELGKDLKVEARSPEDGLVESVSYKDLRRKFVVGVQWHPEFSHTLKEQIIPPEPLYERFLQEVKARKHS
ncbi:MAG TPA: gamma-glutamyl-gamma-aminobutyrate hydrolase family protein [bacterium]|nr:gamma-glutamyl-gamma-aminobutyrate hydrolase family protein [bacterium]